jgi:hypothetical protein
MSLRDYQRAIEGQIEAGFSFGEVEDFINACPLDEEHKSALWLFAWAYKPAGMCSFAESQLTWHITAEQRSDEHQFAPSSQ